MQAELETRSRRLGLDHVVKFVGKVPAGAPVRAILDASDMFVLPSRQEGLPRALIEAMARGLPAIGSDVGGIPELLSPEDTVPKGDASILAKKILEIVRDPGRMAHMSARGLDVAREYLDSVLRERRLRFYRYVRDRTADHACARTAT